LFVYLLSSDPLGFVSVVSSPLNGVAAVVGLLVGVAVPDHDPGVAGRLLHHREDAVVQVLGVHVPDRPLRRRQADVEPGARVRRGPLVPLLLPVRGAARVAVEPDVDAGDEPRGEQPQRRPVQRERAPRRRRQLHGRAGAELPVVAPQARGQRVEVVRRRAAAAVEEEVEAVDVRVAERAAHAGARGRRREVRVPEVVGEVRGGLGARQGVLAAAEGEEHHDALRLAVLDVGADAGDGVAREVQARRAVAGAGRDVEEGDDDDGVRARVAGLSERALGLVPAPEDSHLPGLPRGRGRAREEEGASDGHKGRQGQ
jgi:hypothetical protein